MDHKTAVSAILECAKSKTCTPGAVQHILEMTDHDGSHEHHVKVKKMLQERALAKVKSQHFMSLSKSLSDNQAKFLDGDYLTGIDSTP